MLKICNRPQNNTLRISANYLSGSVSLGRASPNKLSPRYLAPPSLVAADKFRFLSQSKILHECSLLPFSIKSHLVQRHRRISRADLDCDGDLSLLRGPHRFEEMYTEDKSRQSDSGYGTDKRLVIRNTTSSRSEQDVESPSVNQTPATKKPKEEPFEGRVSLVTIDSDGNECHVSGIFGSVAPRKPTLPPRNLLRKASLIPGDASSLLLRSFSQQSDATLCGSINSNGKYEIEESSNTRR